MWIRKKVQTLPWEVNLNFEAIMINYSLICKQEHKFEGWFRTSEDYEEQARKGLVSCPTCHDKEISKALMAQAVKSSKLKLYGVNGKLDSLGLVNLLVTIEQLIEDYYDITITIADEQAMSQKNSPFNTIKSLKNYVIKLVEDEIEINNKE